MKEYFTASSIKHSTAFKLFITALVSGILYWLSSFLLPILLAVMLAFALYPMSNWLTNITVGKKGLHLPQMMGILIAFITAAVVIGLVITLVILPLFGQLNALIANLPSYSGKVQGDSLSWILLNPSQSHQLPSSISGLVDEFVKWVMGFISGVVRNLLQSTVQLVANLFGLIVVPFLSFYFLKDWKTLKRMIVGTFNVSSQPKAEQVLFRIGSAISSYCLGLWKLSFLAGCATTMALFVLGAPYPLVFGVISMFAETIPVVGPIISAVPAIFVTYLTHQQTALYLAIFYVVYYTLDGQVFTPVIMGRNVGLHPVVIIIALLIGAKLFGILGMLFAMPVAAVYRVLYLELWHYGEEVPSRKDDSGKD
jgi:predicted PurR-regulated permease PerM